MMSKHSQLLLFGLVISLFSCKQNWERAIERVDRKLLFKNNTHGWELTQEIKSKGSIEYIIAKTEGDTSKVLYFDVGNEDQDEVLINGYFKTFRCGNADMCYLKMNSQDTLFYYRQHGKEKTFEVGEYAYRFTYLEMDNSEVDYYLEHEDSLKKVRGTNLPRLPNHSNNR